MLKLRPILQRGVTYKVGDGSSFSLWQDIWHIRGPLCLNFPRGPEVTGLPLHSTLSSVLQHNHWTWPASTDSDITEIMSQLPPTFPSAADRICWNSTSGSFMIETAILLIQPSATRVHWHGLLHGKFKIARHGFILWLAILEKLSTMDKPWVPGEANCVLCGEHCNETHDHLFFNCLYSRRCLAILKTKIKFQWPHLEWQRGITWASKKWRGNHLVNAALRATLAALAMFQAVGEFFRTGKMLKQINTTLISLIPKLLFQFRLMVRSMVFSKAVEDFVRVILCPYLFVLVMEIWNLLLKFRTKEAADFQYHWKCIPLTSSRLTIADCRPLIDKSARLAGWNNQILSYAGRLQLIKSVLTTLHTYWASAFILPKGVLKTLEKKMRQFLWQGSAGSGNAKAWEWISKPKEEGGLGIRRLTTTNQALMLKQLWRILQNDAFGRTLGTNEVRFAYISPRTCGHRLTIIFTAFQRNTEAPVGWPASTDPDFIGITSHLPPLHTSAADCISWRSSSGKFTVPAAVSLIQPPTTRVFWYVLLHGNFKIPRHGFILWMAILEKLSTMDKPWVPRAENGCVLCGGLFDETHAHLFLSVRTLSAVCLY
ncbi:UNVERIFIED_CONTAM: hypothetical protein Sradi_7030800 [Sesamum radiatum]|uniref:Reverse transcriptase zinc-binding domain-containing protein n=1 Tax=Sesamum radiatum TaxID=300843 RepID=A0AAW2JBE2_SESRA